MKVNFISVSAWASNSLGICLFRLCFFGEVDAGFMILSRQRQCRNDINFTVSPFKATEILVQSAARTFWMNYGEKHFAKGTPELAEMEAFLHCRTRNT